jgi:hypothetical protein
MRTRFIGTILLRDSGRAYEVWDSQPFVPDADEAALAEIRRLLETSAAVSVPARYQLLPAGQALRTPVV